MTDVDVDGDRRGLDRRVDMLEREVRQLETQMAVMQATLNGLVSTMDSRHKAFERGQDLILAQIEKTQTLQRKQESDLAALAIAPQDLSKAVLTTRMVVGIILTIASIIVGQQASTWGMRSEIQAIRSQQGTQADTEKLTQQLHDERSLALTKSVDGIDKNQKLQQLEIQNLRETILNQRRSP